MDRDFTDLSAFRELGDDPIPEIALHLAEGQPVELVWRNELGGLTFRIGGRFLKWNPRRTGVDLDRERVRLHWLAGRHPAPPVISWGSDDDTQWLLTEALPGEHAVGPTWQARPREAVTAIAAGLRAIHAVPIEDFPGEWTAQSWVAHRPEALGPAPPVEDPVLVHGDACAPNTLISAEGRWTGNVDFGDLAVGDRWADLAIASMSLDWNFGPGHQEALYEAYGTAPDEDRIRYYRSLWELES